MLPHWFSFVDPSAKSYPPPLIIANEIHFRSITDLKGVELFSLDEAAKEDEAMVLLDMKGREVGNLI